MKTKLASLRRLDILGNGVRSSHRESIATMLKQWRQKLGYCSIFAAVPAILVSHIEGARSDDAKKPEASVAGRDARALERLNMSYSKPALLKRQSEFLLPHQMGSFNLLAALAGNDDCPGRIIPGGNYSAAAPYTDSGDTTGANDTISTIGNSSYCYYHLDARGSDHIYTFTLTARGPNPQIQISRTSGSYEPLAYITNDSFGACPAGSGKFACTRAHAESASGGIATINSQQMSSLPLNVPLNLFVDSANNSGPYTLRIQDVTIAPAEACANANPANPIDCAEFFVRQQYLDFLNREPDPAGFQGWLAKLNQCPESELGNKFYAQDCTRIDVSSAFFRSREFSFKGYYVYRFYQVSFGERPQYAEFVPDMWRVTGATDQEFEANRNAFPGAWVARQRFKDKYDGLSNQAFVDELLRTAGMTQALAARVAQWVADLNNGKTRAQVLREIVESAEVDQRFYNEAFVAMQYFGYLRRDPDPDGYNGWLNLLNRTGNYREMVWGFLYSPEYKLRFGPVPGF